MHPLGGHLIAHSDTVHVPEECCNDSRLWDVTGPGVNPAEMVDVVSKLLRQPLPEVVQGDVHGPPRHAGPGEQHVTRGAAPTATQCPGGQRATIARWGGAQSVLVHTPAHRGLGKPALRHVCLTPKWWLE